MDHAPLTTADLRVALFSGNYNYVRDGANQALNRLVGYLLRQGVAVRVYSPVVDEPAFEATGDLVGVPSFAFPGRREYRFATALSPTVRRDLAAFAPNVVHVSSPDLVAHRAVTWARSRNLPVLASVHTRFESYLQYYRLGWLEPGLEAMLRRFYRRCDALVAPSDSFADLLRQQGMNTDIGIWTRGVDSDLFSPTRRDCGWRQGLGIADGEVVIGFLGRVVMEKGLDVFADTAEALRKDGVAHRVIVVGEGPARSWFESRLPDARFLGFQSGEDLARSIANMDVLFNPSVTEAFGNVTLEAMACGVPVVAAAATGSMSIVLDGETGRLCAPGDVDSFRDALGAYAASPELRARHGAAGRQRALGYSWDRINQSVADTYLRLVNSRPTSVAHRAKSDASHTTIAG